MSSPIARSTGDPPAIPFQNAVVEMITRGKVRITGFFLRQGESGTIGFAGDEGATMRLLPDFRPSEQERFGNLVTFAAALEVSVRAIAGLTGGTAGASAVVVQKGGNPFRITLSAPGGDTTDLEVYITLNE